MHIITTRRIGIILVVLAMLACGGWLVYSRRVHSSPNVQQTYGLHAEWWEKRCREHIREVTPEGRFVRMVQDGWFGPNRSRTLRIGDTIHTQPDEHAESSCMLVAIDPDGIGLEYESAFDHLSFGENLITIDSGRVRLPWSDGVHEGLSQWGAALLPDTKAAGDVSKVAATAKAFFQRTAEYSQYWPEPVSIDERDTYWEVGFRRKGRIQVESRRLVMLECIPRSQSIRVEKSDFACQVLESR
jgi:hypothetical protein